MTRDNEPDLAYWTRDVKNPRDPVGRLKLSDLMNYDTRAAYKHKALWEFHLSWSHADYNYTSLASVRTIRDVLRARSPSGKTISIQHINEGNRDLCAWGYMTELEPGKGKRGTRFMVNWDLLNIAAAGQFPPSVHLQGDASEVAPSVHPIGDTCVTHVGDAKTDSVHPAGDKDPATPTRLQDRVKEIDGDECAAPTAPPLAGLSAATAETAQDVDLEPFDKLWEIYGYKHHKREARAAFRKLAPDDALFQQILTAAAAWRESWAAQGNSKAPRFRLDKWLEREEYDCDPPTGWPQKERKAKSAPVPATARPPAKPTPRVCQIIAADVSTDTHGTKLSLVFEFKDDDAGCLERSFYIEHQNMKTQSAGMEEFTALCRAMNLTSVEDADELTFHPLLLTQKRDGSLLYECASADNDNVDWTEAA